MNDTTRQPRGSHDESRLQHFYSAMTSLDGTVNTLSAVGLDIASGVTAADLETSGLDCHNIGGYPQIESIAAAVASIKSPRAEDTVLDAGCGLGGPSR
jgi:hypothetical protein